MSTLTSTDVLELIALVDCEGELDPALVAQRIGALVDSRSNCGLLLIGIASALGHMLIDHNLIPKLGSTTAFYSMKIIGDGDDAQSAQGIIQITGALLNTDRVMANALVDAATADENRAADLIIAGLQLFRRLHRFAHGLAD